MQCNVFYVIHLAVQHERGPRNSTLRKQRQEKYIRYATSDQHICTDSLKQYYSDETSNAHLISSIMAAEPLVAKLRMSEDVRIIYFVSLFYAKLTLICGNNMM